jgi:leader peptidase (prepilin peptidase) / N-methyltransferase
VIIFITLIFSLFGIFIGSFLNNVINRTIRKEQYVSGRSYCESCKHLLSQKDLVPVFSFLLLKGRCRYCKAPIPKILPIVETVTGALFALSYLWINENYIKEINNFSLATNDGLLSLISLVIFIILLMSVLIVIFFSDLEYMLIPESYLWVLASLYFLGYMFTHFTNLNWGYIDNILFNNVPIHFISVLGILVFFLSIYFLTKKRAMGEGDVILAPILALYLTPSLALVFWFSSFLYGSFVGVFLLLLKGKNLKTAVPFGPFLILGFLTAVVYGEKIYAYYIKLITY